MKRHRKTPKFRMIAALLGTLLAGGGVQATTFAPLTLVQQAKKADVIVQATIGIPTTVTEGTQVYAVYPLKVSETLAGDAATLPQTVGSQSGGGPALFVLSGVETAPVFQAGQELVLLLYKGRLDSPLVGYNQGAYLISNGQVSVLNAPLATTPGTGTVIQQSAGQNLSGQNSSGLPLPFQTPPAQTLPAPTSVNQPVLPPITAVQAIPQTGLTPAPLNPVVPLPAVPVAPGAVNPVPLLPGAPGTPISTVKAPTALTPTPPASAPAVPASAIPAPELPTPVVTTALALEAQPSAPVVPATSAAGGSAAAGSSATTSASATVPTGSTQPASSVAPVVTSVQTANAPVTSSPATAAPGVLGTIRTSAELKAAIVAARASK